MLELITMLQETAAAATESSINVKGGLALGFAGIGAGIGVGLTGLGATQAVGRNPGAFGNILTIAIIGMALAEAIAIYALVVYFLDKG
jgi:F-type H+-transporting ATPase subunit c